MNKPAEYRRHAEECRKMADETFSDSDRTQLLGMAETWTNMATSREALLARYPDLSQPEQYRATAAHAAATEDKKKKGGDSPDAG